MYVCMQNRCTRGTPHPIFPACLQPLQFRVKLTSVDLGSFQCAYWEAAALQWSSQGMVLMVFEPVEGDADAVYAWCGTVRSRPPLPCSDPPTRRNSRHLDSVPRCRL